MRGTLTAAAAARGTTRWLEVHAAWAVWLTGAATAFLVVGIALAWSTLRDARTTRHAELLAEFSHRWDSAEIIESAKQGREYGVDGLLEITTALYGESASDPPDPRVLAEWYEVLKWPDLLETLGVMVHAGAIPKDMIYGIWGGPIIDAWERDWKLATLTHRDQKEDRNVFIYFQWLVREMKREGRREAFYVDARRTGPVGAAIAAASYPGSAALADTTASRSEP